MIFLIEYNRSEGNIVTFREFDDSQRQEAEDARLEIELDVNCKQEDHEVVLLDAASKEDLHRTHQRYFSDLTGLLKSAGDQNERAGRSEERGSGADSR